MNISQEFRGLASSCISALQYFDILSTAVQSTVDLSVDRVTPAQVPKHKSHGEKKAARCFSVSSACESSLTKLDEFKHSTKQRK